MNYEEYSKYNKNDNKISIYVHNCEICKVEINFWLTLKQNTLNFELIKKLVKKYKKCTKKCFRCMSIAEYELHNTTLNCKSKYEKPEWF